MNFKLSLTIKDKEGNETTLRPTQRKMRKMINTSLENKFKNGARVLFRVNYGKAKSASNKIEVFDNEIETNELEDLRWAMDSFLDKSLLV